MVKLLTLLAVFGAVIMISACQSQPKETKSPCVGIEGSPCGPRRSANPDIYPV